MSFSRLGIQTHVLRNINIELTHLSHETVDKMYVAGTKGRKTTVEKIKTISLEYQHICFKTRELKENDAKE